MADTVEIAWIYPPNWDGNAPTSGGHRKYIVHLTGISDGTGETDITKVDISGLRDTNGDVVTRTIIESIEYDVSGMVATLEWDRAPNSVIARLAGADYICFKKEGGKADPSEAGDRTGDIMLTTAAATANDSYDIKICFRVKA